MKKIILIMLFAIFSYAQNIEEQICKLYNEAGKARFDKKYAKASVLEERLSNLLGIYSMSVSSCPKEYQEYGWLAEPRKPRERGDRLRKRF